MAVSSSIFDNKLKHIMTIMLRKINLLKKNNRKNKRHEVKEAFHLKFFPSRIKKRRLWTIRVKDQFLDRGMTSVFQTKQMSNKVGVIVGKVTNAIFHLDLEKLTKYLPLQLSFLSKITKYGNLLFDFSFLELF